MYVCTYEYWCNKYSVVMLNVHTYVEGYDLKYDKGNMS